jgi:hypothetical protein
MIKNFGPGDEDATDAIVMVLNAAATSGTPLYSRYRDEDGGITEPLFVNATEKCNAMQDQKNKQAAADDCRMALDNTVAIKASLFYVAEKMDAQAALSDEIKNDVGDVKAVVQKLKFVEDELKGTKSALADKTLKCDIQEYKTAKATQRANECEKNMISSQNMARCDRDARREEEAKRVNAEQMLALYVELHAASAREYSYRVALGRPVSTDERQIAAYGALLLVKDTIINSQKVMALETDARHNAVIVAKDAEAATAMAAKDAEIARLTEELAAFRLACAAMET